MPDRMALRRLSPISCTGAQSVHSKKMAAETLRKTDDAFSHRKFRPVPVRKVTLSVTARLYKITNARNTTKGTRHSLVT